MAQTIDLEVIAPTLPPGSCLDPEIPALIAQTRVLFPSQFSLFIKGANEPTVEQRTYGWMKTDAITGVIQGIFTWSALYGLWLKPHWTNNSVPNNERRIWVGSLTALETYDGGESSTVSDTTGPFWQQATAMADKFPLGVGGTIPTVGTNDDVFDVGTPASPQGHGVYFVMPTGRLYDRSS